LGGGAGFVDGEGFVVAEVRVVSPDGLPFGAVGGDLGVVGDDFDVCGLIWMLAHGKSLFCVLSLEGLTSSSPKKVSSTFRRMGFKPAEMTLKGIS